MAGEAVVFTIGADTSSFDGTLAGLKAQTSKASSSLDSSFSRSFDRLAASADSAGNAITIGVTAPLVAIGALAGNTAIRFTKLYETTMIVFESMLGGKEAADALYGSLLDIAKASTFAQEVFLESGKKLVGMGVDAETTRDILQATTDAVAGFGGSAENIKNVTEAFAKLSNSGRLSMEEVNSLSDNGVQALKILANQYDITTDEMRAMISEGAVPAKDAIAKLTSGIEQGTNGVNGATNAMAGMAASLKAGTLTGAFDSINSAIRSFSLSLVGINPTLKKTDAGYVESEKRIRQLTAAVTEIAEIIPLLAKVFSGVTDAVGRVLDVLVGANVRLDESTHKWKDVSGALGEFKRYLRDTPTDRLAMIGNLLVAIAVTGPALKLVSVGIRALNVAMAAGKKIAEAAELAHTAYVIALDNGSRAAAAASAATEVLNLTLKANPVILVVTAVVALVTALWALAAASKLTAKGSDQLTLASQKQKEELDELQAEYDRICESQGEHSDAALAAKAALDEETAAFENSKQTVSGLVDELADSSAAHKALLADLDKAQESAEGEAGSILALVAQFDALAGKENRSEADKIRLKAVTDELNTSVEGLNLNYDEGNDALSITADAVDAVCRAEANRIRYQQKMEEIPKLLVEEAEKSELLQEAKDELASSQRELASASEKATAGFRKNAGASGKATAEMRKHAGATRIASQETQALIKSVSEQEAELEELRGRINDAEEDAARFATEETALAAAVSSVAAGMDEQSAAALYGVDAGRLAAEIAHQEAMAQEELAQKLNETEQAVVDYATAHPGFREALEASGYTVSSFARVLDAQGQSMDDAASQIEDYRERITSAFDEISYKQEESIDRAAEIYLKNLEVTRDWSTNLTYLAKESGLHFNEGFLSAVRDGGVEEWGQVIDQLVDVAKNGGTILINDTAYTAQEFVDLYADAPPAAREQMLAEAQLFGDVGAAIDQSLAEGMTGNIGTVDNASASVAEAGTVGPADVDSSAAGAASAATYAEGMNANADVVYDACGNIVSAGTVEPGAADSSEAGAANAGTFVAGQDGASGEVAASSDALSKLSADHLSSASQDAWWAGHNMAGQSYAQGVSGGQSGAVAAAMTVSKQVADHFSSSNGDAWWAGYNMAVGMASGISAGQSAAVNAAARMAAESVAAAKRALDEHSPSRVLREVGRNFSSGHALGIADEANKSMDAAADMARSSVESARKATAAAAADMDVRLNTLQVAAARGSSYLGAPLDGAQRASIRAARAAASPAAPTMQPAAWDDAVDAALLRLSSNAGSGEYGGKVLAALDELTEKLDVVGERLEVGLSSPLDVALDRRVMGRAVRKMVKEG